MNSLQIHHCGLGLQLLQLCNPEKNTQLHYMSSTTEFRYHEVRIIPLLYFFLMKPNFFQLTEAGAYPRQPKFFDHFQTYTAIYYGHSELSHEEKSKFEFEEKKFSLLLKREVCRRYCLENATFSNKLNFFSSNSNFDFSSWDNSKLPQYIAV